VWDRRLQPGFDGPTTLAQLVSSGGFDMLDTITWLRRVLLLVLFIGIAYRDASAQGRANGAQSCALLSREVVAKFSAASKKSVDPAGPKELPLGRTATACEWGDLTVQVDPMPAAGVDKLPQSDPKNWEVIQGVGDAAYLHNIKDIMAELFVRVGKRTFAVLVNVPAGTTTAAFKPAIIDVAKEIAPKVR
jgi:hypothetical protein